MNARGPGDPNNYRSVDVIGEDRIRDFAAVVLGIGVVLVFLSAAAIYAREGHFGLLVGQAALTLTGFAVLLFAIRRPPSNAERSRVSCPYCAERILPAAQLCPFCKSDVLAEMARARARAGPTFAERMGR